MINIMEIDEIVFKRKSQLINFLKGINTDVVIFVDERSKGRNIKLIYIPSKRLKIIPKCKLSIEMLSREGIKVDV